MATEWEISPYALGVKTAAITGTEVHLALQEDLNDAYKYMIEGILKEGVNTMKKTFAVAVSYDSQVHPTMDFFETNTKEEALGRALHRHIDRGTVIGWVVKDVGSSMYDIPEAALEELKRGRKIAAIKAYREEHHCGLKDAKDIINEVYDRLKENNELYDPDDA